MNPIQIRFHPSADDEVVEAYRWYRTRSLIAAVAFRAQVDHAITMIADGPERHAIHLHGTRRVLVRQFPFAIVYRITDEGIEIIAVAHHSRQPDYWSDR